MATLISRVEADVALLRQLSVEPFSISISENIDIEIQPGNCGDERICVGRKGWGDTVVNYQSDGVIVDTYAHSEITSTATFCVPLDELVVAE